MPCLKRYFLGIDAGKLPERIICIWRGIRFLYRSCLRQNKITGAENKRFLTASFKSWGSFYLAQIYNLAVFVQYYFTNVQLHCTIVLFCLTDFSEV